MLVHYCIACGFTWMVGEDADTVCANCGTEEDMDKAQVLQAMQYLLRPQRGHSRRVLTRLIRELEALKTEEPQ
ncbi:unnamed protein product [marine sediment metagenome]|uniref:Uncharacterized protein n=1 Tax=marine sediment metagenome TaxID=412755 RepID=X1B1R5_9ZZZZ